MKPSPLDCLFQSTTPTPASVSWILRNRVKQPRRWWTIAGEATPVAVARGCVCSYAEFTDASLRLHYTTCPRIPYSPERSFARVSLEIYSRCHVERRLTPVPVHAANPTTKNSFLKPEIERERGRERERERDRYFVVCWLRFNREYPIRGWLGSFYVTVKYRISFISLVCFRCCFSMG